jgi:DNA-directed RNA polymerase specialized sigma24 family protein
LSAITATSFQQFLFQLDENAEAAAEKYNLLRRKLVKCLTWKGCPETEADSLADTVIDRVATKIGQGERIKSITAYSCEVMRFVWLEHIRRRKEFVTEDGEMPETATEPDIDVLKDPDLRMRCLRRCLVEVVPDESDRLLIVSYYDTEGGEKNKDVRKALAERLGLTTNTLKVKACRIRDRLEKCINECVARLSVTKPGDSVTHSQGGDA